MSVILTSISPAFGPPGTLVTCTGTGFTTGSRVACPTLQSTTFASSAQISASIPLDLTGPAGGTMQVGVYVIGADGNTSAVQLFAVNFPPATIQAWSTIDAVCGEVPGFQRGGQIADGQITTWLTSIAQSIASAMLRRGLSLTPTTWSQPSTSAEPSPASVLEMINRLGAAARLASAVASNFSAGRSAIADNLQAEYLRQIKALETGDHDKLFNPSAVSQETGQQFGGFTPLWPDNAFRKGQKF